MNKQQYMAPRCEEQEMAVESMLANSIQYGGSKGGFGGDVREQSLWDMKPNSVWGGEESAPSDIW